MTKLNRPTIVVAGALAQKPRHGGHAWVFLQYLLGMQRLGWDVLFLDHLDPAQCRDAAGESCLPVASVQVRRFVETMERFGIAYSLDAGDECIGLSRTQVLEKLRDAALLLNVMGYLADAEMLAAAPLRVFLDIDPGFGQMWRALGLHDAFRGHDKFVTVGVRLGQSGCAIPTCGLEWIPTLPPVVLEKWPVLHGNESEIRFTGVASWRGAYGPLEYEGVQYGLRAHEFRQFSDLPRRSGLRFEMALDIHPDEKADLALLERGGWMLLDPLTVADNPCGYQQFIQNSGAEFMVAKNMYVQSKSGWFSDRSACYLASGKPVLAQDTGLGGLLPAGAGLVTFTTIEEAAEGAAAIVRDYERHARSARALAVEFFDSDVVLGRLLQWLGVALP